MSRELNKESEFLQSINKLTDIFNEYIGPDKYLFISENATSIKFHNSKEYHSIGALSSGERHLLVLLTIFVIEGGNRNIFMVDEPEISLNMTWQKKLLPLLHELAPNAQIIVASHSPSVARNNTNYLVELR
jgi:predicted ATPase